MTNPTGLTPVTDPLILKSLQNAPDDQMVLVDPNSMTPMQASPGNAVSDFLYGLRKPIDTGANLLARGLSAVAPQGPIGDFAQSQQQATADATQKALDAYKAGGGNPDAFSGPRLLGETLSTLPLSYAVPGSTSANLLPRVLSNAGSGALSSILTGDPNASASDLGSEVAEGAGLGAAATLGTGLVGKAIQGSASPAVQALMEIGVRPTPGQIAGGTLNRLESAATSIPVAGDLIKNARRRSVLDFNTGVINDALAPIGETLQATKPGRDQLVEMADKISDAYKNAVPAAGGQLDAQAAQQLAQLRKSAQLLPADRARQFDQYLKQYVLDRISPNGSMTGDSFKEAESDLGKAAQGYLYGNGDTDTRNLGGALRQTQQTLRDWLGRVNPQAAGDIQAANSAFARMKRIEGTMRPSEDPGVFSPAQFQGSVYNQANNKAQLLKGNALSQDLADAGRSVLGPNVPDSGTPYRHAIEYGLPLLGGALGADKLGVEVPFGKAALLGLGGAVGTSAALYNPASQNIVANLMASRYPWMRSLGAGISRYLAPAAATGASVEQGAGPAGLLSMP